MTDVTSNVRGVVAIDGHGIDKPKSQRAVMAHNRAWFGHYIFGEQGEPNLGLFGPTSAEQQAKL
jgi:hypothetical protein